MSGCARCGARKDSKLNKIAPGLYYVLGSDNLPAVLLGTHVDDLLWCATPEGEVIMERIMAKFDMGKVEDTDFRYCGRRFRQDEHFNVTTDTEDNTRSIRHIVIDPNRKSTEPATDQDVTRLRSVVGSLAWVARYSRPDLCYRVKCLQRARARASHPSYLLTHAGHRDFDVYKNMQVKLRQLLACYSWPLLACDSLPIHMTQLGSSLKESSLPDVTGHSALRSF